MDSTSPKIPKQFLGFFSLGMAWVITMIIFSLYQGIKYGRTQDAQVIITWSAMFVLVAWLIFIIYPLAVLDHTRKMFQVKFFPLITALYAMIVYAVIMGGLFRSGAPIVMYLGWAALIGVLFGLIYAISISCTPLLTLLNRKPILKIASPLIPLIIAGLFWWGFPTILPGPAFRFMPEPVQEKIVAKVLVNFKKGDKFSALKNALPGYFDDKITGDKAEFYSLYNERFELQLGVENDTIQKFEFHTKK